MFVTLVVTHWVRVRRFRPIRADRIQIQYRSGYIYPLLLARVSELFLTLALEFVPVVAQLKEASNQI